MKIETLKDQQRKIRIQDEATLQQVCLALGIGVRDIMSRSRRPAIAIHRKVVVEILRHRLGWTTSKAARIMGLSTRQIRNLSRI